MYKYEGYHKENKVKTLNIYVIAHNLQDVELIKAKDDKTALKIETALNIVEGMKITKDWVNTPGNFLTPEKFANSIKETLSNVGCSLNILEEAALSCLNMDLIRAIGNSSSNEPRFVVVKYRGNPDSNETIGIVGKGITVDTGGYNLKTADGLKYTKDDMTGAATVAGVMYAAATNKLKVNITGIMPICENRLSNSSLIPGDVITSMNGKTVEILNTDAEGRLILADALTYAVRIEKVDKIIDLATLTGAIVSALSHVYTGAFTNNTEFFDKVNQASQEMGEKMWRFPLDDEYREMIKSKVADLQNIGGKQAGAITAAAFLEEFVEDVPWVHLDIAGTNFTTSPTNEYETFGATGVMVPTLYRYLEMLQS